MREFHGKIPNTFDFEKHLFYYSNIKVFFGLSHFTPNDGDETLLQTAIDITRKRGQKNKISFDEDNRALVFFVSNFLEPSGQFYYEEELEKGFVSLIEALENILEYIRTYAPKSEL